MSFDKETRAEPILLFSIFYFFFIAILFLTYFSQYFAHNLAIFLKHF